MNLRFYKVTYIVTHLNYMDWLYTLSRLFNSQLHDSSAVADMIVQQSLARLFNSHWQDYSTVAGMILQQSLARFFNSHWHNSSTVTGRILHQLLARFFNSHGQIFCFYAGGILQQWRSLLKNRTMQKEYSTWSGLTICGASKTLNGLFFPVFAKRNIRKFLRNLKSTGRLHNSRLP